MFDVELNQQTYLIQVKHSTDSDNSRTTVVAEGRFAMYQFDHTALVVVTRITISPNDLNQLDEFISTVTSTVGKTYSAPVFLRLYVFDGQIDMDRLQFKNRNSALMVATMAHVKYDDLGIQYDREQYAVGTDKQVILSHSQEVADMMTVNAFWATKWNRQEDRINSASSVAMILDKTNNIPCGFGRFFMLTMIDKPEEKVGYMSDIVIDSHPQNKGLGSAIVNCLLGIYVDQDPKRHMNGSLCLVCALKGPGAIAAPKIYKKSGFEFFIQIGNCIALFINEQHTVFSLLRSAREDLWSGQLHVLL